MSSAAHSRAYRLRRKQDAEISISDRGVIQEFMNMSASQDKEMERKIKELYNIVAEQDKIIKELVDIVEKHRFIFATGVDYSGEKIFRKNRRRRRYIEEYQENTGVAKELIDITLNYLASYGCQERYARSLIGKWRKQLGDDYKLLSLILITEQKNIEEPIGYISKAVENASKPVPRVGSLAYAMNGARA